MMWSIWFVSIVVIALRFAGTKSLAYQAMAHLFAGLLLGFAILSLIDDRQRSKQYIAALAALVVAELVAFVSGV